MLAYLAHTNKHFKIGVITNNCNNLLIITKLSKSENAADFSPQKDQNMKQVGRQESYVTCKQAVLNIMLSRLWETAFWKYCHESMNIRSLSSRKINDINREKCVGSIPLTKKPNRNNQCTGRISRQLWVNAPTLSTGSSLSPSLAAAV